MSEEPLVSAEEVASVLSGGEESAAEQPAAAADSGGASPSYSLRRPVAIAPDDEAEARRRVERIAGELAKILGEELEAEIGAEVTGFQQQQASTAVETMPPPTWILEFQSAAAGGIGLVVDPASALTLVELALGGQGSQSASGREPTPLESRVMAKLGRVVLESLGRRSGFELVRSEFGVGKISTRLAAPGEMVCAALLGLKLREIDGRALLLVTAGLLKREKTEAPGATPGRLGPLASRLGRVAVEVRPVLDGGRVTLHDLTELKPEALLKLDMAEDSLLELRVAGQPSFTGRVKRGEQGAAFTVASRRGRARSAAGARPNKKKEQS